VVIDTIFHKVTGNCFVKRFRVISVGKKLGSELDFSLFSDELLEICEDEDFVTVVACALFLNNFLNLLDGLGK
jgi:hypothetical protein